MRFLTVKRLAQLTLAMMLAAPLLIPVRWMPQAQVLTIAPLWGPNTPGQGIAAWQATNPQWMLFGTPPTQIEPQSVTYNCVAVTGSGTTINCPPNTGSGLMQLAPDNGGGAPSTDARKTAFFIAAPVTGNQLWQIPATCANCTMTYAMSVLAQGQPGNIGLKFNFTGSNFCGTLHATPVCGTGTWQLVETACKNLQANDTPCLDGSATAIAVQSALGLSYNTSPDYLAHSSVDASSCTPVNNSCNGTTSGNTWAYNGVTVQTLFAQETSGSSGSVALSSTISLGLHWGF